MKPEKTETLDYLQSHTVEIINSLAEHGEPLIIMQDENPKAVLQDYASYKKSSETIALLKILALGRQEVKEGNVMSVDEAFLQIRSGRRSYEVV